MKPLSLDISQFVGVREGHMDLGAAPVHLVVAENNAGKSTVRDALVWALTGLCADRGVDKKNQSFRLVRHGEKKAAVALACEGLEFTRSTTRTTQGLKGAKEGDILRLVGNLHMLQAVTDAHEFLKKPLDWRRDVVKLITGDAEKIKAAVLEQVNLAGLADHAEFFAENADNLDAVEKLAVEKRRDLKREIERLKAIEARAEVEIGGKVRRVDDAPLEAYEKKYEEMSAEKLRGDPESVRKQIEAVEAELFQIEGATAKDVAAALSALHEARAAETKARDEKAKAGAEHDRLKAEWTRLEGLKGTCPTCGQEIPQAKLEPMRAKVIEDGNKAASRATVAASALETAVKRREEAEIRHSTLDRNAKRSNELGIRLTGLKEDLAVAEAEAGKADQLRARLALGRTLLDAKRAYEQARAEQAKAAGVEAEMAKWDKFAKALGKDGPVRKVASAGFDPSAVQEAADFMLEGRKVTIGPDWSIQLGETEEPGLSESERYRLGAGFAAALSAASGIGILVLDRADLLFGAAKRGFNSWLATVHGRFNLVLVAATKDREEIASLPDWVRRWTIQDGLLQEVKAPVAAEA